MSHSDPSPERAKQHWPAPRQDSVLGLEFRLSPAPEQPKVWTPTHQIKPRPRAVLHGCCRTALLWAGVWLPPSGRLVFLTGSSDELGARSGNSNPHGVASTPCLKPWIWPHVMDATPLGLRAEPLVVPG